MAEPSARSRYEALLPRRDPFLNRARTNSELTLPSLLPPQGHASTSVLYETYQSLGSFLVLNLASRTMTALYPPGMKSFRLDVTPEVLLQSSGEMKVDKDTERGLTIAEDVIQSEVDRRGWRQPTNLVLQHLIVGGNAMEQTMPDNTIRVFRLDQYVVVRDPGGALLEFVIEEKLNPASVPEELRGLIDQEKLSVTKESSANGRLVSLYTWGKRTDDGWALHQEIEEAYVPKSDGLFAISPFRALRWSAVVGEDYGRGKCEEHQGDLRSIEGLSKSIIDGASMASRNVTMIRPNAAGGLNLRRRLAKADNGDFVIGNPEDVEMLQFTNVGGMQFTSEALRTIVQRVSSAFLLSSGMRRDAERVTAHELRMDAEELEGVLGGVYSMLSIELQGQRIARLILQMQEAGQLPAWPAGIIEPTVLTGLESLGREQDVQRVVTALQFMQGLPPEVLDYVKWPEMLGKAFNGLGLPNSIRTDDEVSSIRNERMAAQAEAAVAQAGGEEVAKAAAQAGAQSAAPASQ